MPRNNLVCSAIKQFFTIENRSIEIVAEFQEKKTIAHTSNFTRKGAQSRQSYLNNKRTGDNDNKPEKC